MLKKLLLSGLILSGTVLATGKDSQSEKKRQIAELYQSALVAFANKNYQKAIAAAEKMRQIPIRGNTHYLNEAKQIIDKSRNQQREEFEPFLVQAGEAYEQGDYKGSYDLCMEMVRVDPFYAPAQRCIKRAQRGLLGKSDKRP